MDKMLIDSESWFQNNPGFNQAKCVEQPSLHLAVMQDRTDEIKIILESDFDINFINADGETALHIGVISNSNISSIKLLLEKGAAINAKSHGVTPLHLAADLRRGIEMIELFLDYGADAKALDDFGCSALHYASEPLVITSLIRAGSEVNGKSLMGFTPLHCLILTDCSDECIELLLKANADPNIKEVEGLTPLHFAAKFNLTQSNANIFRILLNHGADLNARTNESQTAFDLAVDFENSLIVEMIQEMGGIK